MDRLSALLDAFDKRLSALETTVNETIIGGLKNAAAEYQDEIDFGNFTDNYCKDYDELIEPSKILFGEDYDLPRELYNQLKETEGYGSEGFEEAKVIQEAVEDLKNRIAQIRGSAPDVEVKVEDAEDKKEDEDEMPDIEEMRKAFEEYQK